MSEPHELVIEHDGLCIAALDWGGDGEPLVLLHPTGFCAGFFDPLARRLRDTFRPIGVDLRGHGGSDAPDGTAAYAYSLMAADVLAVLDHLGVRRWSALGESGGGGVGILVDRARPGAMRRLVLCEAIAFDVAGLPQPREASPGENYMAAIARKRRRLWPDRETVRDSYASRPPLDALAPEFLDAYIRWGFVDRADGQVELACPPEAEASMFEVSAHDDGARAAGGHLEVLSCDAVVLAGTESDLPLDWFRTQSERARAPFVVVDGGHFFLHEDGARAEVLAREHLRA